jgi:hypothetical protein
LKNTTRAVGRNTDTNENFGVEKKKNAQTACKICLLFFKRVQGLVLIQAAHLLSV